MEENLLPEQIDYKLYKDRAVAAGAFLGGPLVAGYLAAENFKKLGQNEKVKNTWLIAIGSTILVLVISFGVPVFEKAPNIFPLAYTLLTRYLVQKYQGPSIADHIEKGGAVHSTWRALGIGLIGLLVILTIVVILVVSGIV